MAKNAELKTKKNEANVEDFIAAIQDESVRQDCTEIIKIMKQTAKDEPKMWGSSIVGFGHYHYKYESGRENDWFQIGFSPRKQNITIYFMGSLEDHEATLKNLGKYTTGKGCLYIKKLEDIDKKVLKELLTNAVKNLKH